MSKKILPSVSDEEFNKAMNLGTTKTTSNTKNNNNSNNKKTINSVLNNKEDINISSLNVKELTQLKNDSNNTLNKNNTIPINNTVKDTIKDTVKTSREKIKTVKTKFKDKSSKTLDKIVDRIKETPEQKKNRIIDRTSKKEERRQLREERKEIRKNEGNTDLGSIAQIILILIVVLALSYSVYYYFNNVINDTTSGINLIEGIRDGKQPLIISQDQNNPNYIPINKSFNLEGGAQFTYSCWFSINNMEYKKGKWKDMWYKGDKYKFNQCPGVFIHENTNKIRINMNVIKQDAEKQEDTLEYVDIDNIPIGVWINMVMVFTEDKKSINTNDNNKKKIYRNCLDIYINGLLKTRKELSSVPLFNTHPLWINMNGGFDGVLGNLEYYPRALNTTEIHKILKKCPGETQCGKQIDCPPYLSNNWWFN